ncbi:MAG: hypothetical protein KGO83_04095, partial [Paenibacillaceae bacterium]|nr:hypothetical protein [Paenibacillaceae bacterium]
VFAHPLDARFASFLNFYFYFFIIFIILFFYFFLHWGKWPCAKTVCTHPYENTVPKGCMHGIAKGVFEKRIDGVPCG